MAHVNRHENMLYELDAKLMILNKTLQSVMVQLSYFHYESNLIDHMQLCINHIYTAVYALKEDINALYEYMRVLSTQQLNPLIIPPDILRYVLEQVKDGIRSNARLMLSEDPTQNIWTYYNIIKVTPIVMDDYLMVILTIPLIDSSLDVNLYKVHNLPMLHPKLQIQVEYQLEGTYFAMHMHGMYATIPKESDIKLCMMSQGHLCMFDEPLYPVEKIEWCLYALFMNDLSKIDINCKFTAMVRHTNLGHSLDGYLWAVSSLATEKLQICCLHHTSVVTIDPPLHIIDAGNGCEAFSPTLYIPVKSELTATMQSLTHSQFFLQYNLQYLKMSSFVIFHKMNFEHLTPDELTDLHAKVQTLKPMNMQLFNAKLRLIDEKYPLTIPPWVTLGGQVISGAFILTKITLMAWFCLKHRKSVNTLLKLGLPFARKFNDNPWIIEQLTQHAMELVANITAPDPPPRVHIAAADSPTIASKWNRNDGPMIVPSTSIAVPSSSSGAHRCTLEFITEAAQELYAKGQLRIKPYAGYLKGKRVQSQNHDSPL